MFGWLFRKKSVENADAGRYIDEAYVDAMIEKLGAKRVYDAAVRLGWDEQGGPAALGVEYRDQRGSLGGRSA